MSGLPALPAAPGADTVKVGVNAGWLLAFYSEDASGTGEQKKLIEISRDDYYGEIEASLPGGFDGGSYTFVIEGLPDDQYSQISLAKLGDKKLLVRLYLYYRDTGSSVVDALTTAINIGDVFGSGSEDKHKDDLVAELRVVSISRKAGARKYEATITARERVFDIASSRPPCGDPIDYDNPRTAGDTLMSRANLSSNYRFHEPVPNSKVPPQVATDASQGTPPKRSLDTNRKTSELLAELASFMEQKANLHGRGMLLIRDGVVHLGKRPIPIKGVDDTGAVKPLTLDNGLVEVVPQSKIVADPNWDFCKHKDDKQAQPMRQQYKLTLRGRPDLKPGDVVQFSPPAEDVSKTSGDPVSFLGGLGDLAFSFIPGKMENPVTMYVASVEHKLGRANGFLTTVVGVEIGADALEDGKWDGYSPGRVPSGGGGSSEATPEQQVGKAVARAIKTTIERDYRFPEVGEIRAFSPDTSDPTAPPQTSTIWRGLMEGNGQTQPARTAEILRPTRSVGANVPYLTPFAWGSCGLILPRYPGMRVLVDHRRGDGNDPIDVGALWEMGHLPSTTQAGDWWLILPAGKPTGNAPEGTSTSAPQDYAGAVTHDLIESDGRRTIEVGSFIVRFGSQMSQAGSRPARKSDDDNSVTIHHAQKDAFIRIDDSGKITLKGSSIDITADGNVTISAKKVDIQ